MSRSKKLYLRSNTTLHSENIWPILNYLDNSNRISLNINYEFLIVEKPKYLYDTI